MITRDTYTWYDVIQELCILYVMTWMSMVTRDTSTA